jgi:hypothetical protein
MHEIHLLSPFGNRTNQAMRKGKEIGEKEQKEMFDQKRIFLIVVGKDSSISPVPNPGEVQE